VLAAAVSLCASGLVHAAPQAGNRRELGRLDGLLAAGDEARAAELLESLVPELARSDRLALDTIYVLLRHGRAADARVQWNRLAPRLQQKLRADAPAPDDAARRLTGEALFVQGLLVAQDGDKAEALKLLGQADGFGFPPLDSPLMLLAADTLQGLQEYGLAQNAYREFLERSPENVPARVSLARALYAERKFDAARLELERALKRAPAAPGAEYLLGAVLVELKRFDEAKAHLSRALSATPRCVGCLSRLAHVAYLEGKDEECRSLLAKASALDPGDVEVRMIAGLLAFRAGRYDEAIDHLSFVVASSPSYMAARYQLATAYRRVGNAEKAQEHFEVYQRLLREQKSREIGFRGQ
jgi:tetratricopeptide (TPR) repeat protein